MGVLSAIYRKNHVQDGRRVFGKKEGEPRYPARIKKVSVR